jgi:hypothetical protein
VGAPAFRPVNNVAKEMGLSPGIVEALGLQNLKKIFV